MVYAPDRPDLFARICGYFDKAGFNIQDARIHTSSTGYALDTFQILSSDNDVYEGVHPRDLISLVENQLAEAAASDRPLHELQSGPTVAPGQVLSRTAPRQLAARRTRAKLAAQRLGQ